MDGPLQHRACASQVKTEEDVYDDVDETTYQELIKKRREENFIEDDDGNGYVDFGQEDWDDAEYSGDENEQMAKRAKGVAQRPRGAFNNLAPKPKKKATERVNGMFLGAGREVISGAKAKVHSGSAHSAPMHLARRCARASPNPTSPAAPCCTGQGDWR